MSNFKVSNYLSNNHVESEPHVCFYAYQADSAQSYEQPMVQIETPLPVEKQLFTELAEAKPQVVNEFIKAFNIVLRQFRLNDITLSKFKGGYDEDGSYLLEWIENYFRIYFSFEKNGDNTVGYVVNDTERGQFSSIYEHFQASDNTKVAKDAIDFMVSHKQR